MKTIAYLSKYFCIVDASEIQRARKCCENSKTFAGFRKTKKNPTNSCREDPFPGKS